MPAGDRFDVARFTAGDMVLCGSGLRRSAGGATSLEAAAGKIVDFLRKTLVDGVDGGPACVLVRFYRTVNFDALDPGLQRIAAASLAAGEAARPGMKCLTLMATAGIVPDWNSRLLSAGHRAIPLPSARAIERLPMISRLVNELGMPVEALVGDDAREVLTSATEGPSNVFYVADAAGSPHVPAQEDFVKPFGVRSVLGFGGGLNSGDLFAVILFSRTRVPPATADLFRYLGSDVRMAIAPTLNKPLFGSA